MRILLVDDNTVTRSSLPAWLTGHEVRTAADGSTALEVLQSGFAPDAIVLDLRMTGMTGATFLRKLHKSAEPPPPVVVITAAEPDDAERGVVRAYAARLLFKPFKVSELEGALREVIGRQ